MKGLFIPEITAEMFRSGCLESIEALMAEGELYDIDYPLEQEPCKDVINRQAVLSIAGDSVLDLDDYEDCEDFLNQIRELPSATSKEQKAGRWIPVCQGDEIINYRCSECEFGNTFGKNTDGMFFCPRCGAKMSEVSE